MSHIVKIEFKKPGAKFESAAEAAATFASDQASAKGIKESNTFNSDAIASGDLVQELSFNDAKDGFILTRTWSDKKWAEVSKNAEDYPSLSNGWDRIVS